MDAASQLVLKKRIESVQPLLNERQRRIYLAAEAESLGWGGMGIVSELAGVDRDTVSAGRKDLLEMRGHPESLSGDNGQGKEPESAGRIRREGAGRKPIEEKQPGITAALVRLIEDACCGSPESTLIWTGKSTRKLAEELRKLNFIVSHAQVGKMLAREGFTLQANRKLKQCGESHPDRDAQFCHIRGTAERYMKDGRPVISVDCKKKENLGEFKNPGRDYAKKGEAEAVLDHDFLDLDKGKAVPYGTYDLAYNEGYVSVGVSSDTAQFAVSSIRCWWNEMGRERYPHAKELYITADGGGSNGVRSRLWKTELQKFADETGLTVEVSHFPPGTSKWNKIEHRMFCYITKNWRARPLVSLETVISLIAATTTVKGLKIRAGADLNVYKTGIKISDEELAKVNLEKNEFHGEWNYKILPNSA